MGHAWIEPLDLPVTRFVHRRRPEKLEVRRKKSGVGKADCFNSGSTPDLRRRQGATNSRFLRAGAGRGDPMQRSGTKRRPAAPSPAGSARVNRRPEVVRLSPEPDARVTARSRWLFVALPMIQAVRASRRAPGGGFRSTAVEDVADHPNRLSRCALRSDDTEAPTGVASGPLRAESALMLLPFCASERLSPSARKRVAMNKYDQTGCRDFAIQLGVA